VPDALLDGAFSEIMRHNGTLRRFLHGLPGVDQAGAEARAAALRAGAVWANAFNRFDPASTFGGYKESGPS
jgi:acyl-CoA reductase-like NAD-dependent aldehyde dehydrogenase